MLTEDEVQKAMDFCVNVFAPTDPTVHDEVRKRIDQRLLDDEQPVMMPEEIEKAVGASDQEAANVLKKHNARKPLREMWDIHGHFNHEEFEGMVISVEKGQLGLAAAEHRDVGVACV